MLVPVVPVADCLDAAEVAEQHAAAVERLARCGTVCLSPPGDARSHGDQDGAQEAAKVIGETWGRVLAKFPCIVGPLPAKAAEAVTQWLNSGALRAIVQGSLDEVLVVADQLPRERLVMAVELGRLKQLTSEERALIGKMVGGVLVTLPQGLGLDEVDTTAAQIRELVPKTVEVTLRLGSDLESAHGDDGKLDALVGKLHHQFTADYAVHVASASVSIPEDEQRKALCRGESLIACLRTDRQDGLYTTVVTDEHGVALGLVYSSKASIKSSLACGRGVYWSRSRSSLWRKGDTSGAFQELIDIDFDCDADALRFKVRQRGAPPSFCHQGHRTCWGADGGLGHLVRTLEARKASAPEGSYTKRLFDDRGLLRNKLLEEAQEVIEAVEEEDPHHVAEEVADLAYFALTACVAGGASLEDVNDQLNMRSLKVKRRPGNAKSYRIEAAQQALEKLGKQ